MKSKNCITVELGIHEPNAVLHLIWFDLVCEKGAVLCYHSGWLPDDPVARSMAEVPLPSLAGLQHPEFYQETPSQLGNKSVQRRELSTGRSVARLQELSSVYATFPVEHIMIVSPSKNVSGFIKTVNVPVAIFGPWPSELPSQCSSKYHYFNACQRMRVNGIET